MKKKEYDVIFSKQKELQDDIKFDDIKDSINTRVNLENKKVKRSFIVIIPMVVLLIAMIIGGNYLYNKNNKDKEYQEALTFFKCYNLISDDLSKDEVIEVHHDVVSQSFSKEVTRLVIKNSTINNTSDVNLTSEEIENMDTNTLWVYFTSLHGKKKVKDGINYIYKSVFVTTDNIINHTNDIFSKYNYEELIWSIDVYYEIRGYTIVNDGILVYGIDLETLVNKTYITKISNDGLIIWEVTLDGYSYRGLFGVFNCDEYYKIFAYENVYKINIYNLSYDGIFTEVNEIQFDVSVSAIKAGRNSYFIFLSSNIRTTADLNYPKVVQIDGNGETLKEYFYNDDYKNYEIENIIEYNDNIYFSGYSVIEIGYVIDKVLESDDVPAASYVTKLLKENYTAVLFEYNIEKDKIKNIKMFKGSLNHDLYIENGKLVWQFEEIMNAFFSIGTSSFTFGGVSRIKSCIYDGTRFSIVDTGEDVVLRK